jgi:hypothetical protein
LRIKVRTLEKEESIPAGFNTGYESMPLMGDWVWIAEDGEPLGVMLAAPCHGLVYMMRVCVKDGANPATALILMRECMKECNRRGFKGYFFHVSTMSQTERDLMPICRKAGAVQIPLPQVMIVGSVERAARV